jgi:hypothetical protein
MRVEPAVAAAGSIVLPKNLVTITSNTTTSIEVEGLERDDDMRSRRSRSYSVVYMDRGHLSSYSYYTYSWEDMLNNLANMQKVHIFRTPSMYDHSISERLSKALELNPWKNYPWFYNNLERWAEMVPVPSVKIAGRLAYYQSVEKRVRNIETPIKAGRWLSKYFGDLLTQEEIQKHGLEWEARFGPAEVRITQDSDEIEKVYQSAHLGSCMWFPHDDYAGRCHPARVYGGGLDLGIAYIWNDESEEAAARCLVWPEKKIFLGKMYGDDFRLRLALEQIGYKEGDNHDFSGARLRRIVHRSDVFVLPYIDTHSYVRDDGDYLILDSYGDIGCQSSEHVEGLSVYEEPEVYATCYDCEDDIVDSDDASYISGRGHCCDSCLDLNHFRCEVSGDYHPDDDRAETPDEWTVAESSVRRNSDWFFCQHSDKWYPHSGYDQVGLVEGGYCEQSYAEANGFFCMAHEEHTLDTNKKVELSDGSSVHLDYFDDQAQFDAFLAERELSVAEGTPPLSLREAA